MKGLARSFTSTACLFSETCGWLVTKNHFPLALWKSSLFLRPEELSFLFYAEKSKWSHKTHTNLRISLKRISKKLFLAFFYFLSVCAFQTETLWLFLNLPVIVIFPTSLQQ
jgi:hypothetical protein